MLKTAQEIKKKYIITLIFIVLISLIVAGFLLYLSLRFISIDNSYYFISAILSVFILSSVLIVIAANRKMQWFLQKLHEDNETISEMYNELLSLNKDVEDIVAERTLSMAGLRIADRIRNPITVIAGNCRNILKTNPDIYIKERLQNIIAECKKMETAVSDFDKLVKSKNFQFKREDLNEIVQSTLKIIEGNITNKDIHFSLKLFQGKLIFNANRQLIRICINHVVNNAIDAASEHSFITIQTGKMVDYIYVKVIDLGHGIPENEIPNIIMPFYSTKGKPGMGLSLVNQIVKEHMGTLHIESKPGAGTNVELRFPLRWSDDITKFEAPLTNFIEREKK